MFPPTIEQPPIPRIEIAVSHAEETRTALPERESSSVRSFVDRRQQILESSPLGQAFEEVKKAERFRVRMERRYRELAEKELEEISNTNQFEGQEKPHNGWPCNLIVRDVAGVDDSSIKFPMTWEELANRRKKGSAPKENNAK
ncbi:hypothetical protein [Planctopirus hydrillae]|uniref:hypothetical protein n=1 Tax=Planctopirus hydrillae TaxID=1841610 RepID=UPI001041BD78|nr:hypothetical protein [Planctopirus hydrillae]